MDSTFSCCAYCWQNETSWEEILSFKCEGCGKRVHYDCIRSAQPSPLVGDTFYKYKCEACGEDGKEEFTRGNISWLNVVMLALYNLQKMGQGKCGYFHWRGHICAFIDQHWITLFGHHRKKTTLWMGTVAGTLSSGCPEYFLSGTNVVEQGYWRLAKLEPPMPTVEKKKPRGKKIARMQNLPIDLNPEERKCRKPRDGSLAAAIELKERRSTMLDAKEMRKQRRSQHEPGNKNKNKNLTIGDESKPTKSKGQLISMKEENTQSPASLTDFTDDQYMSDSQASISSSEQSFGTNSSHSASLQIPVKEEVETNHSEELLTVIKMETDADGDDFDIDIGISAGFSHTLPDPRPSSPDFQAMLNSDMGDSSSCVSGKSPVRKATASVSDVKQEPPSDAESEGPSEDFLYEESISDNEDGDKREDDDEDDGEEGDSDEQEEENKDNDSEMKELANDNYQLTGMVSKKKKRGRPRKRRRPDDALPSSPPPRLKRISVFEEGELLQNLNKAAAIQSLKPELAQLRRKLICNQTNREYGLPVFDLDKQMKKYAEDDISMPRQVSCADQLSLFPRLQSRPCQTKETRDLDRFLIHGNSKKVESRSYTSFHQRLVGLEDHELKPVVSPYTTRILLPFIWRNYNMNRKPLKLRLLQEIQAYPHRNDPTWEPPPLPPLDYCYVRPEHIPSVNALCREFFWPGIDLSECLQYPDFSCVVLYRKIVIAFAFMVPDRGYNEAYISFIFTHPEWRGAGIATFMLYHLIQTCMGKDVLLHVSATNPAMLLYQKFGFKAQEFILNFYHKYFPLNSNDSLHAFLMRLSR